MKVIILAGGKGTRLAEYTSSIPKPMVPVKGKPIIHHIIESFANFGLNEFIIAIGYKGELIKKYIENNKELSRLNINCVNTGLNTMTGGRILKLKNKIKDKKFLITYGDGLSNVNIKKLINFSEKNKKILTVTAVRPPARFGYLKISKNNNVKNFSEKKQTNEGWINGGFFVCTNKIFNYIKNNQTYFEREPMTNLSKKNQLVAFKHKGFWQCMDTIRDKEYLDNIDKIKNLWPWFSYETS